MCCCHNADIYPLRPPTAQTFELLLLQNAEQFRLQRKRQVSELIEEKSPGVGHFEATYLLRDHSRKGALNKSIETLQAQRKTGYSSAYFIAQAYADLGEKDQAFQWLNTTYEEHDEHLMWLKTDFVLDPIRSDPRSAELVRKVGLPQ